VWLIDPKGGHLLKDAIRNKLLYIERIDGVQQVKVALISKGNYSDDAKLLTNEGITLFTKRSGNVLAQHFTDYESCIFSLIGKNIPDSE
jgi:hypothetical protein